MSRCNNCGNNDADPDWGLCYDCFCNENNRSGGALSSIAAINYDRMGMSSAAASCRKSAKISSDVKQIRDFLERNPENIAKVKKLLNLSTHD
jgi:hypothetical protein